MKVPPCSSPGPAFVAEVVLLRADLIRRFGDEFAFLETGLFTQCSSRLDRDLTSYCLVIPTDRTRPAYENQFPHSFFSRRVSRVYFPRHDLCNPTTRPTGIDEVRHCPDYSSNARRYYRLNHG